MRINGGKISYTLVEQPLVEPIVITEWNGNLALRASPHSKVEWALPGWFCSMYNLTLSTYLPKSCVIFRNLLFTKKALPISSQVDLQQCNKEGGRKSSWKEKPHNNELN